MRILTIVHQRDAGAGVFAEVAAGAGHELVEWAPGEAPAPRLDGVAAGLVLGGGMHVDHEHAHPWLRSEKQLLRELVERRTPLLGICLGGQLLAEAAGARPRRAARPEIGWLPVELTPEGRDDPLLGELGPRFESFQWHSYEAPLPPGAVALARSAVCLQGYRLGGAPIWGVQFHPEVTADIVGGWLDGYEKDEDAVRIGLDAEALRTESDAKIGQWNELGRELASRFLAQAERR